VSGYDFVSQKDAPHVGGNIWQGDPWTFSPTVWRYVIDRFGVRSVLDVGSGRGHAARWFHASGLPVVAIDGSHSNVRSALHPTVLHDLTAAEFVCPVDLVHCQEVVEHIPEVALQKLLRTLANGEVIVMSHAEPGQAGYHHVNLQPPEYWIAQVCNHGYSFLDIDTARVRAYARQDGAEHLARSGLVFARRMG
jgi:SAM-dependent methyltransferase